MDKAHFFAAAARPSQTVEVDGFGTLTVRGLSFDQRLALPERYRKLKNDAVYWIVCQGVDGLGDDDLEAVRELDPNLLAQLQDLILALSGLTVDAETAEKNG